MAKEFVIEAKPRSVVGKKVKQLRRQGIIPAVIYGQSDPINIEVDHLATQLTLRDADDNSIFVIKIDGDERSVIARDVQRHVIRGDLIHVDFLEIQRGVTLTAEASLTLVGTAEPELQGLGRTTLIQYSVEIEALPKDLISEIEIDAAMITKPNGSISVSDITLPEGVTILNDPSTLVAKFDLKREETENEDEEAGEEIIEE